MLNMSSATPTPPPTPAAETRHEGDPAGASDLTARARIRDAAIACFAEAGAAGTSVRTIAAAAGVSPGLVIHHFGSKDALRVACDRHVAETIRAAKTDAMTAGASFDLVGALREADDGPPILRYLARTLADSTPEVAELIDEMVAGARDYLAAGVEAGTLAPTDDLHGRASVLVVWSLGALVLHEHVARLTGAELDGSTRTMAPWMLPAMEILAKGMLADPDMYDTYRAALAEQNEEE
jgi:AcrR family transcriptional regulator